MSIFFLFFAFLASLVLIAFLLPSFFFADYKDKTVSKQIQSINASYVSKYEAAASTIKNVNGMVKALSYDKGAGTFMTDIINKVISLKGTSITISAVSIAPGVSADTENISVSGISVSRDNLTAFYNSLKNDGSFENVVLPVASLIEDSNAPFTITFSYTIQ